MSHSLASPDVRPPKRWAAGKACLAAALLASATAVWAQEPFPLAARGCPMAHCDPSMSDQSRLRAPRVGELIAVDTLQLDGAGLSLGCSANGTLAACTFRGDPATQSNLVVYGADGTRIWDDGGLLGASARTAVPLVATDGQLITADRARVVRADPVNARVVWNVRKPDTGTPVSPVPVGDGSMVLLATYSDADGSSSGVSVWNAADGTLLDSRPIIDPVNGRHYATRNVPAVRGNRVYVLAEAEELSSDGRLYALDICASDSCGGRGKVSIAWYFAFEGPSGASPLVIGSRIYFDGRPAAGGGTFFGLYDLGPRAIQVWRQDATNRFVASAAKDPRGGLWVFPMQQGKLLRLDGRTGLTVQELQLDSLFPGAPGQIINSAVTVARGPAGSVALIFATRVPGRGASRVMAVDVSSSPTGSVLWSSIIAADAAVNGAAGQFPIVVDDAGRRRIVFVGNNSSTFVYGEP